MNGEREIKQMEFGQVKEQHNHPVLSPPKTKKRKGNGLLGMLELRSIQLAGLSN